ncbi:MAG TPA: MFS transporter [Acidimicrobiales bacterium]|nr:MFS transporter [Acidimicrobiales bacterium]
MADRDGLWAPHRRAMTTGLILLVTLVAFEALAVNTVMPEVKKDLGGLALYGWVFSAFMLATVVSISVAGREADRRGLAPVLGAGVALFALGLVCGGAAPSMGALVASRVVQGLGAGAVSSVANMAIGRAYPEWLRPRLLAVLSTSWVLPGLLGPSVAAVIATVVGWRYVFFGLLPLVLLGARLALPALRAHGPLTEAVRSTTSTSRTSDALAVALGAALLLGGLSGAESIAPLALVPIGVAILVRSLRRLTPAGTFRLRPGPPAAIALNGIMSAAFFATDSFLPLAVSDVRGRSVTLAGAALAAGALSWTAGAWIVAHYSARIPAYRLARAGLLLVALGIAGVGASLSPGVPVLTFVAAWVSAGLGMGLGYQSVALIVLSGNEGEVSGFVVSARQLVDVLGASVGAGFAGACVATAVALGRSTASGLLVAFSVLGTAALAGAVAARRLSFAGPDPNVLEVARPSTGEP